MLAGWALCMTVNIVNLQPAREAHRYEVTDGYLESVTTDTINHVGGHTDQGRLVCNL